MRVLIHQHGSSILQYTLLQRRDRQYDCTLSRQKMPTLFSRRHQGLTTIVKEEVPTLHSKGTSSLIWDLGILTQR